MKIVSVDAAWLHCPLAPDRQHTSDFGKITSFDGVLVTVKTDDGLVGYGEAKPAVGSAGNGAALVTIIQEELRPMLLGQDPSRLSELWQKMYNGSRVDLAQKLGRAMPILGRGGVHVAAIAGVDLALWDLAGKRHGCRVLDLVGGPCRPSIRGYASGGWGGVEQIGAELSEYIKKGFRAVKMRMGAMDADVSNSVARVRAARAAIGPSVDLMVDAHGTLNVGAAKHFAAATSDLALRFLEEPVPSDDRVGLGEVRSTSTVPIAAGESEFTCYDFAELIERRAIDILQPDLAIAGGLSEGLRIASLACAHRLELAPHCWGSAISFQAARTLAFASPTGVFVEIPMGGAPLLREMASIDLELHAGDLNPPTGHGFGVEPNMEFVRKYTKLTS